VEPILFAQLSFAPPLGYPVGVSPVWVAAKDLNGDGKVDSICMNSGWFTISILTNNGAGTFVAAPASLTANLGISTNKDQRSH
jgi:hypothetical protein